MRADSRAGAVKRRGIVYRRYSRVVDEIINLPTELQFSLLSEEGEVLEEELIPVHRKKHILLMMASCIDCAAFVYCFKTTTSIAIH